MDTRTNIKTTYINISKHDAGMETIAKNKYNDTFNQFNVSGNFKSNKEISNS